MSTGSRIAERVLAVLASVCLVLAFALAALLPPTMQLNRVLAMVDPAWPAELQDGVRAHLSEWVWRTLFLPILVRPSWLLPISFGMVLGGLALTVASRRGLPRTPRWRN